MGFFEGIVIIAIGLKYREKEFLYRNGEKNFQFPFNIESYKILEIYIHALFVIFKFIEINLLRISLFISFSKNFIWCKSNEMK